MPAPLSNRLAVLPQYLLPKQAITRFAGLVASSERGEMTSTIIRNFVARYGVNMAKALNPNIASYRTFNDFFTRATIYLSPKDYHRIHMPCAGRLTRMIYVPGDLFSVNPVTARGVPGLLFRRFRWLD